MKSVEILADMVRSDCVVDAYKVCDFDQHPMRVTILWCVVTQLIEERCDVLYATCKEHATWRKLPSSCERDVGK